MNKFEKYRLENLQNKYFAVPLLLPKNSYIKADTYNSRYTASLLSGCHILAYGCSLARKRKGLASFLHTPKTLSDLCQRTLKVLSPRITVPAVHVRAQAQLISTALRRRIWSTSSKVLFSVRLLLRSFIVALYPSRPDGSPTWSTTALRLWTNFSRSSQLSKKFTKTANHGIACNALSVSDPDMFGVRMGLC